MPALELFDGFRSLFFGRCQRLSESPCKVAGVVEPLIKIGLHRKQIMQRVKFISRERLESEPGRVSPRPKRGSLLDEGLLKGFGCLYEESVLECNLEILRHEMRTRIDICCVKGLDSSFLLICSLGRGKNGNNVLRFFQA